MTIEQKEKQRGDIDSLRKYVGENVAFSYYCTSGYGYGIGTLEAVNGFDSVVVKNGPPVMTFNSKKVTPVTYNFETETPVVIIMDLCGRMLYYAEDHFEHYPDLRWTCMVNVELQEYINENRRKILGSTLNKTS